jgi:predicted PurR-regulated permease PerM
VLTPRIQAHTIKVPSILVFLGVLVGGSLLGITGVLLAVPTLATLRVIFDFFRVRLRTEEVSGDASATKEATSGRH